MKPEKEPASTRERWPLSLWIFLCHSALSAFSLLMIASPLSRQPGPTHPLLVLPFFYLLFCPLPYILSLVVGICDVWSSPRKVASGIALGGSVLALAGITCLVASYLEAMMSV